MVLVFRYKQFYTFIISVLILTDLSILFNLLLLRQTSGFIFLTLIPGFLILQILKLDKIEITEKIVLSVGLSIFFLMFYGLLINTLSLKLGYSTPLATIPLLISFNIAFIILAIIGFKVNKNSSFSLPNIELTPTEKIFSTFPILFPALSMFGTYLMNTTNNNIVLMFLLFLIPVYVVCVCFFNQKISTRLYPVMVFSISISLLLISMLRFPHIYGHDVHTEYGLYFQRTLDNLFWSVFGHSALNASLGISLLPTIFQSIMGISDQEFLFKGVYVSICSFSPLAIYVISKKYLGELHAFLASFFFMSQSTFLVTAGSPRTNLATFFVALAIMVFFNDTISPLKKRILFILFMLSMIVSHYSTTYIFFFIMLFSWFAVEILSRILPFNKNITSSIVPLFFCLIFIWYSQLTESAFIAGIGFIETTVNSLNGMFVEESRTPQFNQLVGKDLAYPILSKLNLVFTWSTFILIGIGVLTMLRRYKEMIVLSNISLKKPHLLKNKSEVEYLSMALACSGLLVAMLVFPFLSVGYGIQRLYFLAVVILSVFFIIGGMTVSQYLFNFTKIKSVIKEKQEELVGENVEVRAYLVILLILIPYFLFMTGALYQIFGASTSTILSSEGEGYDREYIHDLESSAAKWLKECVKNLPNPQIYVTDQFSKRGLISQGKISPEQINATLFITHDRNVRGYIYLNFNNVVKDKFVVGNMPINIIEYSDMFIGKNKIYNNGGSEVWE